LGGGTDGLGVAVAEGDDARAIVAADKAGIANFGLAEGRPELGDDRKNKPLSWGRGVWDRKRLA